MRIARKSARLTQNLTHSSADYGRNDGVIGGHEER